MVTVAVMAAIIVGIRNDSRNGDSNCGSGDDALGGASLGECDVFAKLNKANYQWKP